MAIFGLVAATVLPASAGVARAEPQPRPYAALGDSYSSGVGTYGPYEDCQQSQSAYPVLWAMANDPRGFSFLACGGATINDVRTKQVSGIETNTGLVSITAGGNDVGFGRVMEACMFFDEAACDAAVAAGEAVAKSQTFRSGLVQLLGEIHRRAPGGNIVILGYPRLFEETPGFCDGAPVQQRRININAGTVVLNASIKSVVDDYRKRFGGSNRVQFVDVDGRFAGRRICSTSQPMINGFLPAAQGESFHPNVLGHKEGYLPALTDAVEGGHAAAA